MWHQSNLSCKLPNRIDIIGTCHLACVKSTMKDCLSYHDIDLQWSISQCIISGAHPIMNQWTAVMLIEGGFPNVTKSQRVTLRVNCYQLTNCQRFQPTSASNSNHTLTYYNEVEYDKISFWKTYHRIKSSKASSQFFVFCHTYTFAMGNSFHKR